MKTVERHSYDGNKIIKTRTLVFEPYNFSELNMCLIIGLIQKNLKPDLLKRKKLKFRDDTNKRNPEVTNTKFNELINNLKIFFKKNGLLINWAELSKLSLQKQIYNLAMISPISVEEKQKLIEIVKLDDVANILNEITKFNFYEDSEEKKILQ